MADALIGGAIAPVRHADRARIEADRATITARAHPVAPHHPTPAAMPKELSIAALQHPNS
ncbi:MAG: hypothetical protein IT522_07555 [Burkholderiales bacterium]|nr:hypothetical protein [Burkholderiales bacterium]